MSRVVVIGAGPAGLTAADEIARAGEPVTVVERGASVGGLARTEHYKGFRFDIGGHRFYTKSDEVRRFWSDALGPDMLTRPRLSRIYYRGRFFRYPLQALDTLRGLGVQESLLAVASYARRQAFPLPQEDTFREWVINRFGDRLFHTFFESYTEKVWGISCSELRAEWAAQRIKDLSVGRLLTSALGLRGRAVRSLVEEFQYPRLGPGMLWEAVRDRAVQAGAEVRLRSEVVRLERGPSGVSAVTVRDAQGLHRLEARHFISSLPLRTLIGCMDPPPPEEVRRAADALRHRDYLTVCLLHRGADLFPDNWIYVHDPAVQVARIQNYKNWSPDMVPDPAWTSLGLEYFCQEGDPTWARTDAELIDLGRRELAQIGLAREGDVVDGCVFRVKEAYPIYDAEYAAYVQIVRRFLESLSNLQTIGRNGLHRYNNQDHAMLSGLLAARNLLHGRRYDIWSIATEADYFEEATEAAGAAEPWTQGGEPSVSISVVVPAHRDGAELQACLRALAALDPPPLETILVCDGDLGSVKALAAPPGFLVQRPGPRRGPAAARNAGARSARGEVVLFIDSDVVVPVDLAARVADTFAHDSRLTAVFGSYDDEPADRSLVSRYRNLLHHYVHQESRGEASTFWGACGAVRREALLDVGGFDESYTSACIEDIEFGARLRARGAVIRLDRRIQVKHLKGWTVPGFVFTDVFRRALPWTRLMLAQGQLVRDLNLGTRHRFSFAATAGFALCVAGTAFRPDWGWLAAAFGSAFLVLNARFFAFLARRGGPALAIAGVPLHLVHSLAGCAGFGLGIAAHLADVLVRATAALAARIGPADP